MNRSRLADSLLCQLAYEKKADLIVISEQYQDKQSATWYPDTLGTAAIWILDTRKIQISAHGKGRGFVWTKIGMVSFFSCYFTPNEPAQLFRDKLGELEDAVVNTMGPVVVAGDFNARALEWGMPNTDRRGRLILEMACRTGLHILNEGGVTTFRRPGYTETIPDLSLASDDLATRIQGWRVLEDYTASDHQYITFEVVDRTQRRLEHGRISAGWNVKRMDPERFERTFLNSLRVAQGHDITTREDAETIVSATMGAIEAACEVSMPRKTGRRGKSPAYWWTPEIATMRRSCHRLRRLAQRTRDPAEIMQRSTEHKLAKKQLRREINRSKAQCWRVLTEDVNRDPWGMGYKLVTRRLGAHRKIGPMDSEIMQRIVCDLFPSHILRENVEYGVDENRDVLLFTAAEVERAVMGMKSNKAPGPDMIPSEVLKAAHNASPDCFVQMYNACLRTGVFCDRWKIARLALISKGNGDPGLSTTYRPLCMLDTAGKVLERLIRRRLKAAIREAGDLSLKQFGFRTGRSTADAVQEVCEAVRRAEDQNTHSRRVVLLVTLDVRNAFNSARWVDMLNSLGRDFTVPPYLLRVIDDYFKNRYLLYETKEGWQRTAVTAGVAQGSILGPDLWNAAYDSLLRLEMPDETSLVGYADDVAALVAARNVEHAQIKLDRTMRSITTWMAEHGLSLALSKTEVIVLTKKRIPTLLPIRVGSEIVQTKAAIKYLGIMIDRKLSFAEQINRTADKAARSVAALSRLMVNLGGPSSSKRRLLMGTVQSILLYGAEVWAVAMNKKASREKLGRVQRRSALRVTSAYRTVSEPAVLVIAGVVPIHLLADETRRVFIRRNEQQRRAIRNEERTATLASWQQIWESETRGRWTARLIPNIKEWIARDHGEVGYYLTQFLSGHGYFRSYLHRMGKAETTECPYCPGVLDDAEHTFFACTRWYTAKADLISTLGDFTPETAVTAMLKSQEDWSRAERYVRTVLTLKKEVLDGIQQEQQT